MHPHVEAPFRDAFERETLLSERSRVRLISAIIVVLMGFMALEAALFHAWFFSQFPSVAAFRKLEALLVLLLVYEIGVVHTLLQRALKKPSFRLPPQARFMNALIETSVPTLVIMFVSRPGYAADVLASPPSYAYFLFIIVSSLRLNFALSVFTGAVAAVEYGLLSQWAIAHATGPDAAYAIVVAPLANIAKVFLMFLAGVATGFMSLRIRKAITNSLRLVRERNDVIGVFGQHVSPAVVEALMKAGSGEPESQMRSVCVLFLDIRDFTTFSEQRTPQEVVAHLNALFDFMIEIVNRNYGIVNKFLGDGFMAIFGAPLSSGDDVRNAVNAAVELVARVNAETAAGSVAPTRIGIGLHAGTAVTGTVGSKERREYTIIGDTVNLASRIEQLNKQYGTQILCSEAVRTAIDGAVAHTEVGTVTVKGRREPVRVFSLA